MVRIMSAEEDLERIRKLARHNEASALGNARREGKKEGTQEKAIAIAKNLKNVGINTDIIAKSTDLTIDEILRL